jgi:CHAT domain-containing protein/tetratricopeptide (TPR) repeat protein
MSRVQVLLLAALVCVVPLVPARADDPPKKLTADERRELEAKYLKLLDAGVKATVAGKGAETVTAFEEVLAVARKLYNAADFPDGHEELATAMSCLAQLYRDQGKADKAEPLFTDALAMRKRLFKGDHPDVADSLIDLAQLYLHQGKADKAEPLFTDALAMRKRLFKGDHPDVAQSLNNLGFLYQTQGKLGRAELLYTDALAMHKRLFKGDHPDVAQSLNQLGFLYQDQGKLDKAESLLADALDMNKRLFPGDHPHVAHSLNNLAALYQAQGKAAEAEPLYKEALAMRKRLFKGDHPDMAQSLNNLAQLYRDQGKLDKAESLLADALAMNKRLLKDQDHPHVATSLNNLAALYQAQGKAAEAEPLYKEALAMRKRLFPGAHPDVALSLNNLATLCLDQGKLDRAELLYTDALAMRKRLFPGDHPDVALSLNNLATLCLDQGKLDRAELLYTYALAMQKRLLAGYAAARSEGDALNFAATQSPTRDAMLSLARQRAARDPAFDPAAAYAPVWAAKGTAARVFEGRQARARMAADPALATKVSELAADRRRRAELVLAPPTPNPSTRKQRVADLKSLDKSLAALTHDLAEALPASARAEKLDAATLADLQKALPADAALVDYVRYAHFQWGDTRPAGQKRTWTIRYVVFVVTRDTVTWADLDTATAIEPAVAVWRAAITSGRKIDPEVPAKVRALVWEPVRKLLPANTKAVFVCPDAELCALPFTALPGDQPGTIVLEEFALATIPHPPFLLDKLWPQDARKDPPAGALVVGGVDFDAAVGGGPRVADPLVKAGEVKAWGKLPNTVGELDGIARLGTSKRHPVTRLEGDKATTTAVLGALPKAKVAHFATHGFLADPSFRGVFQLDDKDYEKSLRGERIGRVANNPLLMTGLVLAGANADGTPGRGILIGDALIDLDLSGLELAVLSACETGLGDLGAGGEGVFGLQRAFHYAGARNVVCSLWKVPDASTAALMGLFYANLWEKNLPPVEALRQAQLHLYKNPADIPKLADGFRGPKFVEVKGAGGVEAKPADGKAHPLLWAAFTLSGPGN